MSDDFQIRTIRVMLELCRLLYGSRVYHPSDAISQVHARTLYANTVRHHLGARACLTVPVPAPGGRAVQDCLTHFVTAEARQKGEV